MELKRRYARSVCLVFLMLLALAPVCALGTVPWNDQKLVPADSWVYEAMTLLAAESKRTTLANSAPLSVAELRRHLEDIDYDALSESGRTLYTMIAAFFRSNYFGFASRPMTAGFNFQTSLELSGHTNTTMLRQWDYVQKYHDQLPMFSVPVFLTAANIATIECDAIMQENYWSVNEYSNWSNIPFGIAGQNQLDFYWPKTAYLSVGVPLFGLDFFNLQIGKGALSVGSTRMNSVILSETFETDGYIGFSFYSPRIRYRADVEQLEVNKYLYLHHIDIRPFKWITLSVVEGTLVNAPFEIRFLNPLMIMHSFAAWYSYRLYNEGQGEEGQASSYRNGWESRVSQYMCYTLELTPVRNLRIYALYAQNEMQTPSELGGHGSTVPDGIGMQLGFAASVPAKNNSYWTFGMEGMYTTPWLYFRFDPGTSFVSTRKDNLANTDENIYSWVGTPYGPDSIAACAWFGYKVLGRWSVEGEYRFLAHGENSTSLFSTGRDPDNGNYIYYPGTEYYGEGSLYADRDDAISVARSYGLTGTVEYTNRIQVSGSYRFSPHFTAKAMAAYILMFNTAHVEGRTEHGFAFSLSGTFTLF